MKFKDSLLCKPAVFSLFALCLTIALLIYGCGGIKSPNNQNQLTQKIDNLLDAVQSFKKGEATHDTSSDECVNQVLVKLNPKFAASATNKILKRAKEITGVEVSVEKISKEGLFLVCSKFASVLDMISKFSQPKLSKIIQYVEPNYHVSADDIPNDLLFETLWGIQNNGHLLTLCGDSRSSLTDGGISGVDIKAKLAWADFSNTGSHEVVVAVLDTGIDLEHPDLKDNLWSATRAFKIEIEDKSIQCPKDSHGFNAFETDESKICIPAEGEKHGTHVSGIIGAKGGNEIGITGVVWDVRLMGVKVLNDSREGRLSDIIKGIKFVKAVKKAFEPNAKTWIVNNSYGVLCDTSGPCFPKSLEEEINGAPDLLFVASAGNNGVDTDTHPHFPSSFNLPNVISVAAITNKNKLADFSNFGKETVHIGAPGVSICSCGPIAAGIDFFYDEGTSMAAPFVSGAAALMLSNCNSLTPARLKEFLLNNSDKIDRTPDRPIKNERRLNIDRAIRAAMKECHP